uniref:Uncharacterized protein n=1 Tax=Arundo donax TaxID=35708 RepID=A0A0A9FKH7_ARUDO
MSPFSPLCFTSVRFVLYLGICIGFLTLSDGDASFVVR